MPDYTTPSGITRWPSMIPPTDRLCWRHSARSFSFVWHVPAATCRTLEVRLEGVSVVLEVIGGGFILSHGTRRHVIPEDHAAAISVPRFHIMPGVSGTSVLVHVMRTLPAANQFLGRDPADRLSPWWKLVRFKGEPPGIFPLGLHSHARKFARPSCTPLIGELMLMAYTASAFAADAPAGSGEDGGFFAFLASGLLHDQILELLREGAPQKPNDWFGADAGQA